MKTLNELPPTMLKRAQWAREQILNETDTEDPDIQIDKDELLAWVFNEEDELWYSIDGNYSRSSPKEKMKRRQDQIQRDILRSQKYAEENANRWAEIAYWSGIREKILERDNHACQGCDNKISKFHIHHILPRKKGGTDHYDNLITLCAKCHKKYEGVDGGLS